MKKLFTITLLLALASICLAQEKVCKVQKSPQVQSSLLRQWKVTFTLL